MFKNVITKFQIGVSVILLLSLTACATVFSGTTQTINIQAIDIANNKPLNDVHCVLTDSKAVTYPVIDNPGAVLVTKGSGVITPKCLKNNYTQKSFGVGNNFNAITIVNVLFWPGFIVDALSGAMHKYPSHITVFMELDK